MTVAVLCAALGDPTRAGARRAARPRAGQPVGARGAVRHDADRDPQARRRTGGRRLGGAAQVRPGGHLPAPARAAGRARGLADRPAHVLDLRTRPTRSYRLNSKGNYHDRLRPRLHPGPDLCRDAGARLRLLHRPGADGPVVLPQPRRCPTTCDLDVRAGGAWRVVMGEWVVGGSYVEVEPPTRLVFTFDWEHDDDGPTTVTVADHPGGRPDPAGARARGVRRRRWPRGGLDAVVRPARPGARLSVTAASLDRVAGDGQLDAGTAEPERRHPRVHRDLDPVCRSVARTRPARTSRTTAPGDLGPGQRSPVGRAAVAGGGQPGALGRRRGQGVVDVEHQRHLQDPEHDRHQHDHHQHDVDDRRAALGTGGCDPRCTTSRIHGAERVRQHRAGAGPRPRPR